MADARALLKAKRLERTSAPKTRIGTISRSSAADQTRKGKRKLDSAAIDDVPMAAAAASSPRVIASSVDDVPPSDKRRRVDSENRDSEPGAGGFPANFFSDPSRTIPTRDDDDDENEETKSQPQPASSSTTTQSKPISQPTPIPASSSIDDELAAFERAIQASAAQSKQAAKAQAFSSATITAEPELVRQDADAGFPAASTEERRPPQPTDGPTEEELAEIEEREKKQEEERELIMDRLVDEERAQEEADAKVNALKARLEAIKLKRAAKKKDGGGSS